VTANSVEVTGSAQGVRQFCPVGKRASAPCGLESNWSVVGAGSDATNDGAPGMLEQAETPRPQAAMMMLLLMVASTRSCGWPPRRSHDATQDESAPNGVNVDLNCLNLICDIKSGPRPMRRPLPAVRRNGG
jgi:hypothetical protein